MKLDEIGIDRPIKDELELEEFIPKYQGVEQDVISEEESGLGGLCGPHGAGVGWALGPPCYRYERVFRNPSLTEPDYAPRDVGRLNDDDFRTTTWPRN